MDFTLWTPLLPFSNRAASLSKQHPGALNFPPQKLIEVFTAVVK